MSSAASAAATFADGLVDGRLDGAACAGRAGLFDERTMTESGREFAARLAEARAVCSECPVLTACASVAAELPARYRRGVYAGHPYGLHRLTAGQLPPALVATANQPVRHSA